MDQEAIPSQGADGLPSQSRFKPEPIECQEHETYQLLDISQSNLAHIQERVRDEQ